jgi:predicted house-cleaning noncanonical NTP pyrophosphatase (MazG superfamily)
MKHAIIDEDLLDKLLDNLLEEVDHDIAKDYREETAEDPEWVQGARESLKAIIRGAIRGGVVWPTVRDI